MQKPVKNPSGRPPLEVYWLSFSSSASAPTSPGLYGFVGAAPSVAEHLKSALQFFKVMQGPPENQL